MQHQLNCFCLPDILGEGSVRTFGVRLSLHVTFLGEITEFPIVESASEGSYAVSIMEEPSAK